MEYVGRTIAAIIGVIVLILVIFSFGAFKKVPNGYVALSYGGGVFEGQHFQGEHVGPTGLFPNGYFDKLYLYPNTQRDYTAADEPGAERGPISVLDADGVLVKYESKVNFRMNQGLLRLFHDKIGIKYNAWCNEGERDCSKGWVEMLNAYMGGQEQAAFTTATKSYHTADFLDRDTIQSIATAVGNQLKTNTNKAMGADFFCGLAAGCPEFNFILKSVSLPDGIVAHFQEVQESQIAIQTKENEVKQAELEAEAIAKRQAALESCGQTCILYEAIHQGGITFWVLDGQQLTVPATGGSTPTTPKP